MRDERERDDLELEARLIRALETAPEVAVPAGFAKRVAALGRANTPAQTPVWTESHGFGSWIMRGALVMLFVAMLLLAPWAGHRSVAAWTLEYAFAFEFIALTVWMSLRPQSTR